MIEDPDDASWDEFLFKLRVLRINQASCYLKVRIVRGKLHRKTLKYLNDFAAQFIK